MKIGVFGSSSADISEQVRISARRIGAEIARAGHVVITGATSGVPRAAVLGSMEVGGRTIGFSPATNLDMHVRGLNLPAEGYSELIFIPDNLKFISNAALAAKYRSILAVHHSDAVIIIGGRTGTMAEFLMAYDAGKIIGILEGSGGVADNTIRSLLDDIKKPMHARIIMERDPVMLVKKVIEINDEERHITF